MQYDYSKDPISIAAIKAEKHANASLWSPRDALIDVLAKIDRGEIKPDRLMVIFRETVEDEPETSWVLSNSDPLIMVGMLERAKFWLLER